MVVTLALGGLTALFYRIAWDFGPPAHWGRLLMLAFVGGLTVLCALLTFLKFVSVVLGEPKRTVELSDYPLAPGKRYQLYVCETNSRAPESLGAWLVCEEAAERSDDTASRLDAQLVYEQPISLEKDRRLDRKLPLTAWGEFETPADISPAQARASRKRVWKIVIAEQGEHRRWDEWSFPVEMLPATERAGGD